MKERILELFEEGTSPTEIARETGVSYGSVYGLTTLRARGFTSLYEYQKHRAKTRGFNSTAAYLNHIAKRSGHESNYAYRGELVQERGFQSLHDYNEHLAQRRGFSSKYEYDQSLAQVRSERQDNQDLSRLLTTRLTELGKNQSWLADQLGVSRQAVSSYTRGRTVPRPETMNRLLEIISKS